MKTEKSFGEELLTKEQEIMTSKKTQYSTEGNEFQNFYEVANFLNYTPEEVALIYLLKHIQCISLAVRTGNIEWSWTNQKGEEGLKQRFADARNYLYILGNMIDYHNQKQR